MEPKLTARICRLCLENSDDFVNIFENFQDSTIASILTKHFWIQVDETDGLSECICQICWTNTKTFHDFYKKVELRQKCYRDSVKKASVESVNLIKRQRNDSPKNASPEPDLNIVKCEETELTLQTNDTRISEDSLDYSDDQNETGQPSDDEDETPIDETRYDKARKKKQNDQIRELFTMKCDICSDVKFEDLPGARDHYHRVHQMRGYLMCCGKQFFLRAQLLDHIRHHNSNYILKTNKNLARMRELFTMKCDICTAVKFDNLLEARRHYRTEHKMKGYLICCGKKFFHNNPLMQHVRLHNNPDTIEQNAQIREVFTMRCDICSDAEFEDLVGARRHYRMVHNTRAYLICCDKKFWFRKTILEHVQTHIKPDAYQCDFDLCGKRFYNRSSLKNHFANHTPLDSRTHKCSLCPSSFEKTYLLRAHVEAKHNSKTGEDFPCDKCDKKSKLLLTSHVKYTHEINSLDHVCEICANRYKTKKQLETHLLRQHSTQPKVQCSICGNWLKHKESLIKHVKTQHQETREVRNCPKCKKKVNGERALRGHLLNAHAERRYQCIMCGKSFKKAITLKEHMAGHTGNYLYTCQFCKKAFNSSANLYTHRKKKHLAEWERDIAKRAVDAESGM